MSDPPQDLRTQLMLPTVREAMSRPVVVVAVDAWLADALVTLTDTGLRHLVAVDQTARCVGVLADREIVAAWAQDRHALTRLRVRDVLPPLAAVNETATVPQAALAMCANGQDAVAVVDADGRPVGVITGGDLALILARGDIHEVMNGPARGDLPDGPACRDLRP